MKKGRTAPRNFTLVAIDLSRMWFPWFIRASQAYKLDVSWEIGRREREPIRLKITKQTQSAAYRGFRECDAIANDKTKPNHPQECCTFLKPVAEQPVVPKLPIFVVRMLPAHDQNAETKPPLVQENKWRNPLTLLGF